MRLYRSLAALGLVLCAEAQAQAQAFEQRMLEASRQYMPTIRSAFDTVWPDAPMRSVVAAQIEKESRWNPRAELCVPRPSCSRERGIGLGQFTITMKFNAFAEMRAAHPFLADWTPDKYFDPTKQIFAIVVKDRGHYRQCSKLFGEPREIMACVTSSYNGGFGGVMADHRLCTATRGCNPKVWFGHVSETSLKAKKPLEGYGQSFYQINRDYARGTVLDWNRKYTPHLGN